MEIEPIKTAADHAAALQETDGLMSAEPGTPEGDRPDVLVRLVEAYQARHFPLSCPTRLMQSRSGWSRNV